MISEINYEKSLLINNRELTYKGIFKINDLFATINRALEECGYTKREKKNEETITNEGRTSYIELRPFKEITNYIVLMQKIKIKLNAITETVTEINGQKGQFQQGEITIGFDAWVMTSYSDRWGMKPWFFFAKGMINKYLVKRKIEDEAPGQLVQDTAKIYAKIKKQLNSYAGKEVKQVSEEDIVKKVEEELKEEIEKEKVIEN